MNPIGKLPVTLIDQGHITELMLAIEFDGHRRAARVVLSVINRIFGYALAHRSTRNNPAQGLPLGDMLKPMPRIEHRAAITKPVAFGKLIRDIDRAESGSYCTVEALKLIPRLFLRSKEIRYLKREYIDFDQKLLIIPRRRHEAWSRASCPIGGPGRFSVVICQRSNRVFTVCVP
jgi:integrase